MKTVTTILFCALLTSCGDGTGPKEVDLPGTYDLQTLNGSPLPYLVGQIGLTEDSLSLESGFVNIFPDGTYADSSLYRQWGPGGTSLDMYGVAGTWLILDEETGRIEFTHITPTFMERVKEGTVSGRTLETRHTGQGVPAVYRRR